MAGWNHDNTVWTPKKCAECGAQFTPKSGAHKFCSPQCKGAHQYTSGKVTTDTQYRLISGNWPRYMSRLLAAGGKRRSDLTRDMLLRKLEEQGFRCALTGVELTCVLSNGTPCMTNASVDRIVAGGPYQYWNIQLVCRAVNMWRSNLPVGEFVEWCQRVVDTHKLRSQCSDAGKGEYDHGETA